MCFSVVTYGKFYYIFFYHWVKKKKKNISYQYFTKRVAASILPRIYEIKNIIWVVLLVRATIVKMPWTGWLKKRNIFLIVLEPGKSKIKVLVIFWWEPVPYITASAFLLCPQYEWGGGKPLWGFLYKNTDPIHVASTLVTPEELIF